MFERGNFSYLLFFILDIGLTLLALSLAKVLRETLPFGILLDEPLEFNVFLYLIVAVIWVIVFMALKIYSPARSLRYAQDIPAVWGATLAATLIFAGAAYLLFRELSRLLFLYFFILDILFLSVWRWLL
ncbi:MAG: hypothetical protein R3264_16335, partial [Anaerolineae bacterium]|nr:hypothetical protein [Anaerolineae bacterium]